MRQAFSVVSRERLSLEEDIISMLRRNRLRKYVPVLQKDEGDWLRCVAYEAEGTQPRGRPKKALNLEVELRRLRKKLPRITRIVCICMHLMH